METEESAKRKEDKKLKDQITARKEIIESYISNVKRQQNINKRKVNLDLNKRADAQY